MNGKTTAAQAEILKRMEPDQKYTANELGVQLRTLNKLEFDGFLISSNWQVGSNVDWNATVQFRLAEKLCE